MKKQKEEGKLNEFKGVNKVRIISDDEYFGQTATILDAEEHSMGVDLRIVTKDGGLFWISSDSVEIFSKEV